eukprot:1152417-Pelagomonas_calceolata.AAC.1
MAQKSTQAGHRVWHKSGHAAHNVLGQIQVSRMISRELSPMSKVSGSKIHHKLDQNQRAPFCFNKAALGGRYSCETLAWAYVNADKTNAAVHCSSNVPCIDLTQQR